MIALLMYSHFWLDNSRKWFFPQMCLGTTAIDSSITISSFVPSIIMIVVYFLQLFITYLSNALLDHLLFSRTCDTSSLHFKSHRLSLENIYIELLEIVIYFNPSCSCMLEPIQKRWVLTNPSLVEKYTHESFLIVSTVWCNSSSIHMHKMFSIFDSSVYN